MGKITFSGGGWFGPRKAVLVLSAVVVSLSVNACGVIAENDDGNRSSATSAPANVSPSPTRTPAPNPTPGKGGPPARSYAARPSR